MQMFIGRTVTGTAPIEAVLFDFELPNVDTFASFNSNGIVQYADATGGPIIPTMWHVNRPMSGVGENFQIRFTLQAGSVTAGGSTFNTWLALSTNCYILMDAVTAGRVLVEIRDIATSTVQASSRFWKKPYAP